MKRWATETGGNGPATLKHGQAKEAADAAREHTRAQHLKELPALGAMAGPQLRRLAADYWAEIKRLRAGGAP